MSQVKLVKFKFKPEGKQTWLDWSEELKRRKDEVIATLKDEGVRSESCFLDSDGETLYYFMEAEDFEKVRTAADKSTHPIDADHKVARQTSLEKIESLEVLFHFSTE